jgi:Flp pilus assembly protein TadD
MVPRKPRRNETRTTVLKSTATLLLALICAAGQAVAAQEPYVSDLSRTEGLSDFVEARILEANGQYRDAVAAYERAVEKQPSVLEVRVRYASLLVELGLAKRAVEVLDVEGELDWYGLRVRALALARHSGRNPESLGEAEAALRVALDEREDDPSLQLALVQVLHREGKVAEAEEVIAQLRAARGGSPQLVAYHAGLLRELDRDQEAAELYARCAAETSAPREECRENLVQVLIELGRPGEAGEIMLRWLEDDDLDELLKAASLLYEGGRNTEALRTVRRVLRVAPDSERARTLEAYLLSGMGNYEEASAAFRTLLRHDRDNLDLMLAMAWATANTGDADEARKWIDRAWEQVQQESGPSRASRVALSAARVELVGDHTARAREWLDRVVDYEGVGEQLVFLTAEAYRRDERWSDGVAALLRLQPQLQGRARQVAIVFEAEFRLRMGDADGRRLLRPMLDSEDPRDVLLALQVLQQLERWGDVEQESASALVRFPEDRQLRFTRAAGLERLGRADDAERLFQSLIDQDPGDAASANYLGYSWADRGENLDEALNLIARAVAIEPENPAYLDSLGWVHYRLGDLDQAEYWLRRAIGFGGGDGTILAHLGEVLLERGDVDEARLLLQRALDAGCDDPEHVRQLLERPIDGD